MKYLNHVLVLGLIGTAGCGKISGSTTAASSGDQQQQVDSLQLAAADQTAGGNSTANYYVHPISISFGQGILIGVIVNTVGDANPPQYPNVPPSFEYSLNIRSGVVTDNYSGQTVYTLNSDQESALINILRGSEIKHPQYPMGIMCPAPVTPNYFDYADLITDKGDFVLGGYCGANQDLYRAGTWTLSGLQDYLSNLEQVIDAGAPTPVPAVKVLGIYPLNTVQSITFQHSGGLTGAVSSSVANVLQLNFNGNQVNAVVTGGTCKGEAGLTTGQVAQLQQNLGSAYLAVDSLLTPIPSDIGDYHLTLNLVTPNTASTVDYVFQGGEHSHNNQVIYGQSLKDQLNGLLSSIPCISVIMVY